MFARRADRRRADRRAFRPTTDARLEPKIVMSFQSLLLTPGHIQTAFGGHAVEVTNQLGQRFYILATIGTVQAYNMPGGAFGLILNGSSVDNVLTINPVIDNRNAGTAHQYNARLAKYNGLVDIGSIIVANGTVSQIDGYRDAILSGPLIATSSNSVDRIAFDQIVAGASINVGGDLDTLDVLNGLTLSGAGTGILVNRDLNSLSVGGTLQIQNNAVFNIGRDVGDVAEPAKGTGPAGQGAVIGGDFNVINGGKFAIDRSLDDQFVVEGSTTGASNITIVSSLLPLDELFLSHGGIAP